MQAFNLSGDLFAGEQQVNYTITSYDTPFPVLVGSGDRAASEGLVFAVKEPTGVEWDLATVIDAADPADAYLAFSGDADSRWVIEDGRTPNAMEFWSGGAAGWHGVTQRGRVAYYLKGIIRPAANRDWFAPTETFPAIFAVGGQGYARIVVNGADVLEQRQITETGFLANGLTFTDTVELTTGDVVEMFYVQRSEDHFGGFVFKLAYGEGIDDIPSKKARAEILGMAPVIGCGIMDSGVAVPPKTVRLSQAVVVDRVIRKPSDASFDLPLINPSVNDGTGWEFVRDPLDPDDMGSLRYHAGNIESEEFDLKKGRLVRITETVGAETWPLFTGIIKDVPAPSSGIAKVVCLDPAFRMLEKFDKNHPDRIDYMARNYFKRLGATKPAYPIPAFDNWPLEHAIGAMALRAGLDESCMRKPLTVGRTDGSSAEVVIDAQVFNKFRARAMNGKLIRLSRPVHYGNYGSAFTEFKPIDDEYVFKPENTKELWGRVSDLCDRFGYDVAFDELGDLQLRTTNNPCYVYKWTTAHGGGVAGVNPDAYAGTYVEASSGTFEMTVQGARIDVAVGRFAGAGSFDFEVALASAPGVPLQTGTVATSSAVTEFFYNYRAATDGVNSTVATLYSGDFDQYIVTITPIGTVRLDCVLVYHTDPELPRLPVALDTRRNAIKVEATDTMDEMRNFVIVVGRRKALVTDSDKLDTNPENPESEFVVAAAVDKRSISDRTALNYIGMVKETVIYSDGIVDDDFAQYLARVFIYRYRVPKGGARIDHTVLPVVQLRDPVFATEARFQTITGNAPLWITRLTHRLGYGKHTTDLECTPYPEYPSYEPRVDINIDQTFSGMPAINVQVGYTSLDGTDWVNPPGDVVLVSPDKLYDPVDELGDIVLTDPIPVSGGALSLAGYPWPPVPGTLQIRPQSILAAGTEQIQNDVFVQQRFRQGTRVTATDYVLTNLQAVTTVRVKLWARGQSGTAPGALISLGTFELTKDPADNRYRFYYELIGDGLTKLVSIVRQRTDVVFLTTPTGQRILVNDDIVATLDVEWVQGKQESSPVWLSNTPYHRYYAVDYAGQAVDLPWEHGNGLASQYARNSTVTHYEARYRRMPDEYEDGSPFYDPYTSEIGRLVKVQADFLVSGLYRVSVRSAHDGTVLSWLTEPTNEDPSAEAHWSYYSAGSAQTFLTDMLDQVGSWNFAQSEDYANSAIGAFDLSQRPKIGKGFYAWNRERDGGQLAPMALISGALTASAPTWGPGCVNTYASWYLVIEATNDELEEIADDDRSKSRIRQVDTRTGDLTSSRYLGLRPEFQENVTGSKTEAYIHTHLPDPTKVELKVADWIGDPFNDQLDEEIALSGNWSATPDADATLSNYKPVRVRFSLADRPGTLWTEEGLSQVSVKLTRHAHLKALVHDQFVVFHGVAFPDSRTEARQVVSRTLHNDSTTVTFPDNGYRKAESFATDANPTGPEWIFRPQDIKKDWTGAGEEPIEFGNYLQLEEVPKTDPAKQVAGTRSRYQLGFMGWLWYLSVYSQDRSGRLTWALNPSFVDTSKITENTEVTSWPEDLVRMHRRTVICRQWTDELVDGVTSWVDREVVRWGLSGTVGAKLLKHKWEAHSPNITSVAGTAWSSFSLDTDAYTGFHISAGTLAQSTLSGSLVRQLTNGGTGGLGVWEFETLPTWRPCVTRDFWPFQLVPPMMDWFNGGGAITFRSDLFNWYATTDVQKYDADTNQGNDTAKGDVWSSGIWDQTEPPGTAIRFWPGTKIQPKANPLQERGLTIAPGNVLDYTRQDETVHYEELRGMWSRGPRPAEQPRKTTPVAPYFINAARGEQLSLRDGYHNPAYGRWAFDASNWFALRFRHEYLWESGSMFPTDNYGVERHELYNYERTRFPVPAHTLGNTKYDSGAWVGWKDDLTSNDELLWDTGDNETRSVFDSGRMPVALGPQLPETRDVYMHLVLLNERRDAPVGPASVAELSPVPNSIVLSPASLSLTRGKFWGVNVSVLNAASEEVRAGTLTYSISNPAVCEIIYTENRLFSVRGKAVGSTTITVSLDAVSTTLPVTVA